MTYCISEISLKYPFLTKPFLVKGSHIYSVKSLTKFDENRQEKCLFEVQVHNKITVIPEEILIFAER